MDTSELVEAAVEVHEELGDGWTEKIYHRALEKELSDRGVPFTSEATLTVTYKGSPVGRRRPDLFVTRDDKVLVVELKAGSDKGEGQLSQYLGLVENNSNFDELEGGLLLQFNEELNAVEIET